MLEGNKEGVVDVALREAGEGGGVGVAWEGRGIVTQRELQTYTG